MQVGLLLRYSVFKHEGGELVHYSLVSVCNFGRAMGTLIVFLVLKKKKKLACVSFILGRFFSLVSLIICFLSSVIWTVK